MKITVASKEIMTNQDEFQMPDKNAIVASLLASHGVEYVAAGPYLSVGTPGQSQGWLLHVSVTHPRYLNLLTRLIPVLASYKVAYKVVCSESAVRKFNNGVYGKQKIGKAVTIFVEDDTDVHGLLGKLFEVTEGFYGPAVATDYRIAQNLYYRYGSFKAMIGVDAFGNKDRLMLNGNGRQVKDIYDEQPILPEWLVNPFTPFVQEQAVSSAFLTFEKKYRPYQVIKPDAKGNVYKAIYKKGGVIPSWCIVKQANKGMFADETGADIRNRLLWQGELMSRLKAQIHFPKVIDTLLDGEQAFLVMSLVHGESINKKCFSLLNNQPFHSATLRTKRKIIQYLLQVAQQVNTLHNNGIVHRDVSANNFLVDAAGQVVLIDLEMAYDQVNCTPCKPFYGGTPGYMSPQQLRDEWPQTADDVYAFGALMISCLVGIEPRMFFDGDARGLAERLDFFLGFPGFTRIVTKCLAYDAEDRPTLSQVIKALQDFNTMPVNRLHCAGPQEIPKEKITELVQSGLTAIAGNSMTIDGLWYSAIENPYDWEIHPAFDKAVYLNLYRGVSGPLYLLFKAKAAGFDIDAAEETMRGALAHLLDGVQDESRSIVPGLYYGAAGIGLVICQAMRHGLVEASSYYREIATRLLVSEPPYLDLLHGLAGNGLAIMQCADEIGLDIARKELEKISRRYRILQQQDGSWEFPGMDGEAQKINSFGYGIAGIVYFLLAYGEKYACEASLRSARRGLGFLEGAGKKVAGHIEWQNSNKGQAAGVWFCHGGPGIALAFLKGYSVTGNERYRDYAEQALRINPAQLVSFQLGQCHGLAGLGEIYLEAYEVTGNEEWTQRASWIAQELVHLASTDKEGTPVWCTNASALPTAELMTGSSGILHFLMHYTEPTKTTALLLK